MQTTPVARGYIYILIKHDNDKGVLAGFPGINVMSNGLRNFGGLSTPGRSATAILFPLSKTVEYPAKSAICDLYTNRSDHPEKGSGNGISFFARWMEKRCKNRHHALSVARLDAHPAGDSYTAIVRIGMGITVWKGDRKANVDRVLYAHN